MLSPKAATILNLALLASAAPSKRQATGSGACSDVHIFLARGWNEPYPGRQQSLVDAACNGVFSCDYEDITFDATNANGFPAAVEEGRSSGLSQVRAYTERCPDSKIALSGYSEGAVVVNNVLADSGLTPSSAPGNKGTAFPSLFLQLDRLCATASAMKSLTNSSHNSLRRPRLRRPEPRRRPELQRPGRLSL